MTAARQRHSKTALTALGHTLVLCALTRSFAINWSGCHPRHAERGDAEMRYDTKFTLCVFVCVLTLRSAPNEICHSYAYGLLFCILTRLHRSLEPRTHTHTQLSVRFTLAC